MKTQDNLSETEKVKHNFAAISKTIAAACTRSGRQPSAVSILAAAKSQPVEKIQAAIAAGVKICGQNYIQEAEPKINEIGHAVQWHFIGHLQSNKVKKTVELFDCIQTVDSLKLAKKINDAAEKQFPIFIEINIGREKTKAGIMPERAVDFCNEIKKFPNLKMCGLMCTAPFLPAEQTRPYFQKMKLFAQQLDLKELSMGMSNDYAVAVEEGSTMVRLGTALFGER